VHYNYHRTYDPSTGRYLESDPIGLVGGLNTYGYALQNPLTYDDPLGLFPSLYDFVDPRELDLIFDSFRDAAKNGYYDCLLDCLSGGILSPVMGLLAKEGGIHILDHSRLPERTAGRYYRDIKGDKRFTQGGKYSRVLVPKAANYIRFGLKAISVVGFADFYRTIVSCTKKCTACLN